MFLGGCQWPVGSWEGECVQVECISAVLGDQFTFNSVGLVLLHCKVEGEGSW